MESVVWWALGALALWVTVDAVRRCGPAGVLWGVGTLLLAVVVAPSYFALRPLRAGETREGGRAWNVLKGFALTWTGLLAAVTVSALAAALPHTSAATSDAERAGQALGAGLVVVVLGALWFVPMVGAVLLGFFLRKPGVVERGPTGRLAQHALATA